MVTAVAVGLTTLVGFVGLTGETGDVTFVGFDTLLTHVLVVVVHGPITGCPYGFEHVEERIWVMLPVKPVGQERLWDSVVVLHDGGFHEQVLTQSPQTGWPYGSGQVLVLVLAPD